MNIGKAYSGLTDAKIAEMTKWFLAHTIREQGLRLEVEPKIVLEVAFNNMMRSTRHESGYALRFPRIVRLRPDKLPEDADTIETVREIFSRQSRRRLLLRDRQQVALAPSSSGLSSICLMQASRRWRCFSEAHTLSKLVASHPGPSTGNSPAKLSPDSAVSCASSEGRWKNAVVKYSGFAVWLRCDHLADRAQGWERNRPGQSSLCVTRL